MQRMHIGKCLPCLVASVVFMTVSGCVVDSDDGTALPQGDGFQARDAGKEWEADEEEPSEYRYVRVNDLSVDSLMGAQIDAVMVDQLSDGFCYPDSLEELRRGDSIVVPPVEEYILGPPDVYEYDGWSGPWCEEPGKYVELGGKGGYLVVRMECEIDDIDQIIVLEQYDCAPLDEAEEIEAFVGTTPEGPWIPLEQRGDHPELRFRTTDFLP